LRLADGELLGDERAATVTTFVERALAWFAAHGIIVHRVMTDGARSYTRNCTLRELFAEREIRHIVSGLDGGRAMPGPLRSRGCIPEREHLER
jgi:hypothetical protein